ncbi:MAG: hypothetical protein M3018_05170, partial [Actinomycetota bacterium]|nr:hypothetical protein [Actinomycetota bacterium]
HIAVSHLGTTSIVTRHGIEREKTPLVEATLRHVMVDRETLAKTAIPDWVRDGLAPWMVDEG